MPRKITLDSCVFISAIKGDEKFSGECKDILKRIGTDFILYQPTICITEVYNAVGRVKGKEEAEKALKNLKKMVYYFEDYGSESRCELVGKTALEYGIYSTDAFFLQTSLDNETTLISLDEQDFISKIKNFSPKYQVYHVKEVKLGLAERDANTRHESHKKLKDE